ncbi:MAG: YeiH family protein [Betaproteobacteria bacterium]|nr:YeiH family protein [Betaproteobacteria bacterium]
MTHSHHHKPHPPLFYGLLLSGILAVAGFELGKIAWFGAHGFSALTIAIVLGMIVGNTFYHSIAPQCGRGVGFSKQTLLRAGIVLFGLKLTLQDIAHVGVTGVTIDVVIVLGTFILSWVLGTRLFGMDRKSAMLIGVGSAICGAAAVIAAEPVVRGRAEQVTVAVATVVVFGTIGIFLYPVLYSMHLPFLPTDYTAFGIYAGSTIHEVAQVVAAARSISDSTADIAVITKMVRVMLLAPFLIGLSAWLARDPQHQSEHAQTAADGTKVKPKLAIPWFAFGFIGMVVFNSLHLLPHAVTSAVIDLDTLLLSMAMAALGLSTHVGAIRQAGIRPILLATVLFAWLVIGGAFVNQIITAIIPR